MISVDPEQARLRDGAVAIALDSEQVHIREVPP
jgi:hypothetical protein